MGLLEDIKLPDTQLRLQDYVNQLMTLNDTSTDEKIVELLTNSIADLHTKLNQVDYQNMYLQAKLEQKSKRKVA